MATKYTLTYFPVKGIAEPIRFLLAYGGADWTDVRFEQPEWPEIKSKIPYGRVPTLEFDGRTVHQSLAICRYLGKKYKLDGDSELDSLLIDVMADTLLDFRSQCLEYLSKNYAGGDVETLKKLRETAFNETIPFYFTKFESHVKENNGHFINGKLTWLDVIWAAHSDNWEGHFKGILAPYPNLKALQQKVFNLPGIKEWVATRPDRESFCVQ